MKVTDPAEGSSSRRMSLAVVLLPHPDSPTKPNLSSAPTERLTPSTALIQPLTLAKRNPCVTGKCFLRPSTCSSVVPTPSPHLPTMHGVPCAHHLCRRIPFPAPPRRL